MSLTSPIQIVFKKWKFCFYAVNYIIVYLIVSRLGKVSPTITRLLRLHAKKDCYICGKKVWGPYLKEHLNTHKGPEEKPKYPCEVEGCGKSFNLPAGLRRHNLKEHGEKMVSCPGTFFCNMIKQKNSIRI